MTSSTLLFTLLATPFITALLAFACRWCGSAARTAVSVIHLCGISLLVVLSLYVVGIIASQGEMMAAHRWLHLDSLSALFLAILGIIGFLTGLYSVGYMNHEVNSGEVSVPTLCHYYGFFHLFLFTMLLVITSNNLIVSNDAQLRVSGWSLWTALFAGGGLEVCHHLYCRGRIWVVWHRIGLCQRGQCDGDTG